MSKDDLFVSKNDNVDSMSRFIGVKISYECIIINFNYLSNIIAKIVRKSIRDPDYFVKFLNHYIVVNFPVSDRVCAETFGLLSTPYITYKEYYQSYQEYKRKFMYEGLLANPKVYEDYCSDLKKILKSVFITGIDGLVMAYCIG